MKEVPKEKKLHALVMELKARNDHDEEGLPEEEGKTRKRKFLFRAWWIQQRRHNINEDEEPYKSFVLAQNTTIQPNFSFLKARENRDYCTKIS